MVTRPPSIVERLTAVRQRLYSVRASAHQRHPHLTPSDLRLNVYSKLLNTIFSAELALAFSADELRSEGWWNIHTDIGYARMSQAFNVEEIVQEVSRLVLFGTMHSWFSVTESTLRQLCSEVCPPEPPVYKQVYTKVFQTLNTAVPTVAMSEQVFDFARTIRNAIHTNGYHSSQAVTIPFRGTAYPFTQGAHIAFADWLTIIDLFEDMGTILIDVMQAPTVLAIPAMKDRHDLWP